MIIILEPQKDTYVTNLKTINNDGAKANVGHAATLDLFKLHNENKHSHSWAAFNFSNENIANDSEFLLNYSDGTSLSFIFKNNETTDGSAENGKIIVGIQNATNVAERFRLALNNVNTNNAHDLKVDITAYNNSSNQLLLKQNKPGSSGDIGFTVPTGMTHIGGLTNFARIDYSAALVRFDLKDIKEKFSISDLTSDGAFSTLKAELVLKDVTTGVVKPKNFTLEAYQLVNDFNEGVGKDTVHFSDKSDANFQTLNGTTNWEIESFISAAEATSISGATFEVEKGDEDLVFDITDYIKAKIVENPLVNKGILIKFPDNELYDEKSYFAKRTGSRHLINKKLRPELRIKIDDASDSYTIPTNSYVKRRYLNSVESFYLFNNANSKLEAFESPTGFNTVEFEIGSIVSNKETTSVTNYKGDTISGIKKASLTTTDMSRYNATIEAVVLKDKPYEDTIKWYYTNVVNAGSFDNTTPGKLYKIKSTGDTDFTNIGAANSSVGTFFIATGVGEGTGSAYEVDMSGLNFNNTETLVNAGSFVIGKLYKINLLDNGEDGAVATDFINIGAIASTIGNYFVATGVGEGTGSAYEISDLTSIDIVKKTIYTEKVKFYPRETANEIKYENLIAVTRINENDLSANDSISSVEVYFVDTKKEFNVVKTPYELPSENLGDVYYQVIDIESGKTLINYHESDQEDATKMFFDGEKYKFNFYVPKKYKDLRLNFKFMYQDPISGTKKYIFNEKYSVRVV